MKKIWMVSLVLAELAGTASMAWGQAASAPTPQGPDQPAFTFGGMLDGYYVYNFPNQSDNLVGQGNNASVYFYNGKDDSLALGLAELAATAAQGEGSLHLVLADGISGPVGLGGVGLNPSNPLGIDILQAYLSYQPGPWTLTAGRFVGWMGEEVIESQNNWNYTHSLLFEYTRPYWTMGLSAAYSTDPTFKAAVYVVNGWNNASGSGIGRTYGFQLGLAPDTAWKFTLNGIIGPGSGTMYANFSGTQAAAFAAELLAGWKATDQLSFALEGDYVGQDVPNAPTHDFWGTGMAMWGVAFYARYQIQDDWAMALRLEDLEDANNQFGLYGPGLPNLAVAPAKDLEAREATLTFEHRLTPHILCRLEGRYDASYSGGMELPLTNGPFIRGSVADQKDEITGTASVVYSL